MSKDKMAKLLLPFCQIFAIEVVAYQNTNNFNSVNRNRVRVVSTRLALFARVQRWK